MKLRFSISMAAILALALSPLLSGRCAALAAPEVIDRIVATVNGRVVLQSDLDEGLAYESLLSNRPLTQFSDEDRRVVLDRLIDQELLREQMKSSEFRHATPEEVSARIAEARKQYPQAATEDAWQSLLAEDGMTESSLATHVRQEIDLMRLVDARLRPAVQVDSKSIEAYYRDQFVPKLKESGAREVALADVSGKIRELLTQEKVSEMLVAWLQTLRSEGDVHIPGVTPAAADPGVQSQ